MTAKRYAVIGDNNVVKNSVRADSPLYANWIESDAPIGSLYNPGDGTFSRPEPVEPPPSLGMLTADRWSIPADGVTEATIKYADFETVNFIVDGELAESVEPVDGVATFTIAADAPGPFRIEVKDKFLNLIATQV